MGWYSLTVFIAWTIRCTCRRVIRECLRVTNFTSVVHYSLSSKRVRKFFFLLLNKKFIEISLYSSKSTVINPIATTYGCEYLSKDSNLFHASKPQHSSSCSSSTLFFLTIILLRLMLLLCDDMLWICESPCVFKIGSNNKCARLHCRSDTILVKSINKGIVSIVTKSEL